MKKINLLFTAILMLVVSSCADKNAFTLTGKLPSAEFDGKQVYLQEFKADGSGFTSLDSAKVEKGQFTFKGTVADSLAPGIRFITVVDAPKFRPALFILEAGEIEINIDTIPTVKGTPMNDQYQAFATKSDAINKKMQACNDEYTKAEQAGTLTKEIEEKLTSDFKNTSEELKTVMYEYTKSNITNAVGEFFFLTVGNALDESQLKELVGMSSAKFKENEKIKKLLEHFANIEASAEGKAFIDIKGNTPEGKEIALSEYAGKGKVVLIDFWASWCGPCIKEMPSVVVAYNKYKAQGFEIVGVSLDEDKEAWTKAIKDHKMNWIHMSDLQGWQSKLSAPYGVNSIPHTVLINKDGIIVAKGLRGDELAAKIEELLK